MKLTIHTIAKDALRLDYHLVEMLKYHVDFADEIIVMEGYSTDGTYEAIQSISDKIKIIRQAWIPTDSYCSYVNVGLKHCTGDWCIKLDADEFIPEWEWDRLRSYLGSTQELLIPVKLRNFYGSYMVEHINPNRWSWPESKWCIHPNRDDFKFWGDGANAQVVGKDIEFGRSQETFEVHHFGTVRHASRLREKWRTQAIREQRHYGKYKDRKKILPLPRWIFDLFPYNWMEPKIVEDLKIYPGPHLKIVEENPSEFIRDNLATYKYLMKLVEKSRN